MDGNQVLMLGLGIEAPWKLVNQHLDISASPNELVLEIEAERGSLYPCPTCSKACPAHDFKSLTWRHLNFFQHHCYIKANVPRTRCAEHGVKRVNVPWARAGVNSRYCSNNLYWYRLVKCRLRHVLNMLEFVTNVFGASSNTTSARH